MKIPVIAFLCVFLSLHLRPNVARTWTPETFPNPTTDVNSCGRKGVQSWICDPDNVISYESANVVEGILKDIQAGKSPYVQAPCGSAGLKGYQVAVALMRQMATRGDPADAAKTFAVRLHDRWGVGDKSCNNGVLLLLAVDDRQLYISTGTGAAHQLTYDVLGNVIDDVRPLLKEHKYDSAVERAVVDIGLALAGQDIEPEHNASTWDNFVGLGIFVTAVGSLLFCVTRREAQKQKRYQDCKSKLEKLKRDQAAMRASTYNPTSCPVCLEDFADANAALEGSAAAPADQSKSGDDPFSSASAPLAPSSDPVIGRAKAASDDELRQPLVAGEASSTSPRGVDPGLELTGKAASAAPGVAAAAAAASSGAAAGAGSMSTAAAPLPPRRPLVLPCGHAFCEPCITMWLEQKKVTCPICRKPFDEEDAAPTDRRDAPLPRPPSHRDTAANTNNDNDGGAGAGPSTSRPPCTVDDEEETYGMGPSTAVGAPRLRLRWRNNRRRDVQMPPDLLMMEMLFRLRQLQRQHPDYVTPSMAQSWEQDLQNGRELSAQQLREFQLNDPAVRRAHAASGSRGTSISFGGGGGGGGGRGGSW